MAKFFEPISASATHIYHSALELCPLSSIVRRLFYGRCHGITRLPRVMIGTPNSWDPIVSFSGEEAYKFCAWSPCGRFVAAQTEKIIEIRNQHTFELLTILHPPNNASPPTCPLAYSPDGRSLASGLSNTIVIWDIQTGGVAKEIECCWVIVSMAWSSDGGVVATILRSRETTLRVETYKVASGARLFAEESGPGVYYWQLWAHEKSFRFMTVPSYPVDTPAFSVQISEIGATPTQIESFTVPTRLRHRFPRAAITFSPSTYHVSIFDDHTFQIIDVRSSDCLIENTQSPHSRSPPQFSPDGSFFTTSQSRWIHAWKFTSGRYTGWLCSLFPSGGHTPSENFTHFSPASSSILLHCGRSLRLRRLDCPPTTFPTILQRAAISRSGTHIATAYKGEGTITIISTASQAPRQFIDTRMEIQGLVITGNVLLVAGRRTVEAWLLTEEGTVSGVSGDKRACHNDSIWSMSPSNGVISFSVHGQFGVIHDDVPYVYHTETGNILDDSHKPGNKLNRWNSFHESSDVLHHHCRSHRNVPPEDGWSVSSDTIQGAGWVMDPEGRHRLWIPFEWRGSLSSRNWCHDITTLFTSVGHQLIVIKF